MPKPSITQAEIRAILDSRDAASRRKVLPLVEKILELGPEGGMVADLKSGSLSDGTSSILIDKSLLDQIKFIREGQFDEKEGATALRLIGDVQMLDTMQASGKRGVITKADLIKDFLNQVAPYEPAEYIRCAVEGSLGDWFPIHYFAALVPLNKKELEAFILKTSASEFRRKRFVQRAKGEVSAYGKAVGTPLLYLKQIQDGKLPKVKGHKEASNICAGICALKAKPPQPLREILSLLSDCFEAARGEVKGGASGYVRKAVCRIDELYYFPKS
ncbi:MAG: hypothetical protein KG075_01205 [Alphaproteobacteria bacterium]|nr:hypothetical protein [Alphaproteobacteria bacterium]